MSEIKNLLYHCKSEEEKIQALLSHRLTKNINDIHKEDLSLLDKIADKVTEFSSSKIFFIGFLLSMILWIVLNVIPLTTWDDYPFQLLNLALALFVGIQTCLISLSQARESKKQKMKNDMEYEINYKTECLTEKMVKDIEDIKQQLNKKGG